MLFEIELTPYLLGSLPTFVNTGRNVIRVDAPHQSDSYLTEVVLYPGNALRLLGVQGWIVKNHTSYNSLYWWVPDAELFFHELQGEKYAYDDWMRQMGHLMNARVINHGYIKVLLDGFPKMSRMPDYDVEALRFMARYYQFNDEVIEKIILQYYRKAA